MITLTIILIVVAIWTGRGGYKEFGDFDLMSRDPSFRGVVVFMY